VANSGNEANYNQGHRSYKALYLDILHLNVLNNDWDLLEIDSVSIFTCPLCENILLHIFFSNILIKTRMKVKAQINSPEYCHTLLVHFRQGKWMLHASQLY
jgi:hypothetical protein